MSNAWLTYVFDHSPARSGARHVLLALADRAHDDGRCYPAVTDIARRAGVSEGHARKLLRELERAGELRVVKRGGGLRKGGAGVPNTYQLVRLDHHAPAGQTPAPAIGFAGEKTPAPATAKPSAGARQPPRRRGGNPQEPSENPQALGGELRGAALGAVAAVTDPAAAEYNQLVTERRADTARQRGSLTPKPVASAVTAAAGGDNGAPRRGDPERRRGRIPDDEQQRTYALLRAVPGLSDADARDLARDGTYAEIEAMVAKLARRNGQVRNPGGFIRDGVRKGWAQSGSPENVAEAARGCTRRGEVVCRDGPNAPRAAERFADAT